VASIVTTLTNGGIVEVGVVGQDGVIGMPALLGTRSMPLTTFIQIAGSGFRIKAERLKEAFERPGKLRACLQRYLQSQFVQVTQSFFSMNIVCVGTPPQPGGDAESQETRVLQQRRYVLVIRKV
jgi:hypothetical protein